MSRDIFLCSHIQAGSGFHSVCYLMDTSPSILMSSWYGHYRDSFTIVYYQRVSKVSIIFYQFVYILWYSSIRIWSCILGVLSSWLALSSLYVGSICMRLLHTVKITFLCQKFHRNCFFISLFRKVIAAVRGILLFHLKLWKHSQDRCTWINNSKSISDTWEVVIIYGCFICVCRGMF
jgi:hypothetical protein